jgi:hypothetical protein
MPLRDDLRTIAKAAQEAQEQRSKTAARAQEEWNSIKDSVIKPVLEDLQAALTELSVEGGIHKKNGNTMILLVGHPAQVGHQNLSFVFKDGNVQAVSSFKEIGESYDTGELTRDRADQKAREFFERWVAIHYP